MSAPSAIAVRGAADVAELDGDTLVRRAAAGDRAAFGELYARHRLRVHRVLGERLRQYPSDVADVAGDVFMTALEKITSFRGGAADFESWLNVIVRHRADSLRQWRARRREDDLAAPATLGNGALARRALSTEDHAILRLELARMLGQLPAHGRLAVLLRDWSGLSYAEVAERLRLATTTAERVTQEARRTLRLLEGGERAAWSATAHASDPDPAWNRLLAIVSAAPEAKHVRNRVHRLLGRWCRTAAELDQLLARYEATYPGHVREERSRTGRRTVVYAPGATSPARAA